MNEAPPIISGASKSKKHFPWTWIILAVILCVPVIFIGSFLAIPFITIYQADEGFKKAKKTIDPEQLRNWALDSIKSRSGTNDDSHIPRSEIPKYVQNLYHTPPEDVIISRPSNGNQPTVIIFWGGGFFHWTLEVGDTNFSMPFNSENQEYPYNFQLAPGIYYTRESSWGLW
jgi:hypothetical protein